MHRRIVDISLRYRFFVLLGIVGITMLGIHQYRRLPVDAFPDISPIMVPVFTEAHGMAPEEVERMVTFPIESTMNGLPGVSQIKSTSAFGMSVVYVYFEDDVDIYFARQVVSERLNHARTVLPQLPEQPTLGPISTGLGQIFIYYLTIDPGTDTEGKDPITYLREVNDWIVKYQLQSVKGVTDILSIGGYVLQYQIRIDPTALNRYGISLEQVVQAIRLNNENTGGQFMQIDQEEHLVRGIGLLRNLEDIRNIHIRTVRGVPIRVGEIAIVDFGREIRRGVVSRNGTEEVVSGIVLQLFGENTSHVIERLYEEVPNVQASLPEGVHLVPYYEQADLVNQATWTVKKALLFGAVLAGIVLVCFLGNIRTALIVALALPLCAFISFILMRIWGLSANLMSLGGIAIAMGMLVDGSIVMVENIFRHLNADVEDSLKTKTEIILEAAKEVARPILFALLIVIIVFLPIFFLQGIEGKMFSPMAYTLCFALFGSLLVAIIAAPALCTYLLRAGRHKDFFVMVWLQRLHDPCLSWSIQNRWFILAFVCLAFIMSVLIVPILGTEFVPTLEEGSILIGVTMAPSISLQEATQTIQALERKIIQFSPVEEVVSRIGRPEAGSHPHPVNYAEIHITLTPFREWSQYSDKREFIEALHQTLSRFPGVQLNFTQPIQNAFDELLSGIKAQIAIKLFGEDLNVLRSKAMEIQNSIDNIPGLVDLSIEQSIGQPQVQVVADRRLCARYGVNVSEILQLVETAIGGQVVEHIYLNARRFGIHVRYDERYRNNPDVIGDLLVHTEDDGLIPLKQVAQIKHVSGPIQIQREQNQRRWIIQGNVRGRDLGGVIADIKKRIADKVRLPSGYRVEFGGQFENQQRAMARLSIIVPVVIGLVFLMLCLAFGSIASALLVMINIPLAMIGGVFGLYLLGEYLSVPAAVGFIALFGVAVQDSIVLVSCINQLRYDGLPMKEAIIQGCHQRFRPVVITTLTTILGLLPLLLSHGIGSEVQRPLAAVVIFGLASSTFLTLFVIPAFYQWFRIPGRRDFRRAVWSLDTPEWKPG
ncbi:MAG: efflux RND transporter permease subunit [Sedimentisphaerales bacterium]|nr:efflux RND transporter permease subunit [Sedimentisphaerales bacterium]